MRYSGLRHVVALTVSVFITSLSNTTAVVSPHQNDHDIPAHQLGRELGWSLVAAETSLLNPELCRFEKEEKCQELDRSLQAHAHRTLQLIQSTGSLKVLVILLKFDNHQNRSLVETSDIDMLFNAETSDDMDDDIIPTGSIKSYLKVNSHNSLEIDAFVVPWMTTGFTEQECLFGNSGLHKDFQKCFWHILDLLDKLHVDPTHSFKWGDYDINDDGFLDSVVVMHSGYGAEWGGTDPDGNEADDRIWSHSIAAQSERWQSPSYRIDLGGYCVTSSFRSHEGDGVARIGIVVHELIHTFGIPDLFDLSRSDQRGGVGSFSIASDAWGQGDDTTLPGHLDPWSKMKLGWVQPTEIKSSGVFSMKASEVSPDVFIISDPYPDGEYLLIEFRRAMNYDENLWTDGAVIWHIDDTVSMNSNAGGPYQGAEWPTNGKHYQVAVVQADGLFELEQGINKGDAGDLFTEGSILEPGRNGTIYPNTDSYQGGVVVSTGITISDFIMDGGTMSFTVSGLPEPSTVEDPVSATWSPVEEEPVASQCLMNINSDLCAAHMEDVVPLEECDCWSFCGNGVGQVCCKFGELCQIDCQAGGTIAGCTLSTTSAGTGGFDFMTPGSEHGFYRPYQPEHEILNEIITEEEPELASCVTSLSPIVTAMALLVMHMFLGR